MTGSKSLLQGGRRKRRSGKRRMRGGMNAPSVGSYTSAAGYGLAVKTIINNSKNLLMDPIQQMPYRWRCLKQQKKFTLRSVCKFWISASLIL